MNIKTNALGINSILAAISSSILATILHEAAHYCTAKYFGIDAALHHNYVMPLEHGTEVQMMLMAAAGPLVSFILGAIVMLISIQYLKPSLFKLFMTWFGMNNILFLFGYVLIAPIAKQGDTGKVFDYFGIPTYLSIAIAIASFVFINYLFGRWSNQFVYYKNSVVFDKVEALRQMFLYPILASIIVMTLLSFPIITWVSLLPVVCMPMVFFKTRGNYKKQQSLQPNITIEKVSTILLASTISLIILFRYLV